MHGKRLVDLILLCGVLSLAGGCVARATEAVSKLPGFIEARFDLAGNSAVVKGNVDPQAVIQALNSVGYSAEMKRG